MPSLPASSFLFIASAPVPVVVPLLPGQDLDQSHQHAHCIREQHCSRNDGIGFCLGVHVSPLYDHLCVIEDVAAKDKQTEV